MTSENVSRDDKPGHPRRGSRFRRAAVASGLAAGVALLCAAAVPATAAHATTASRAPASGVTGHATAATSGASAAAKQAVAYWTRSRMLSARSGSDIASASAPGAKAAPARVSGPAGQVSGVLPKQALAGPTPRIPATGRGGGSSPDSGIIGSPWTGNFYEAPATTTGKVFFRTANGGNWVCSGSAVNSAGKDTVITAGHCVFGSLGGEVPGEGWHSNWIFVPDYSNGYAPYGEWTAKEFAVPTAYYDSQDEGDDMAGVAVNTNSAGQHLVNVVGGQGFAWNWPSTEYVYDFGYPAAAPFNGATLQYCNGSEFNWADYANTSGLECNFTGGSSGGPWLMSFGGEWGYVDGVNDFTYSSIPGYIFSAHFGNNAESLYNTIANA